MRGNLNHQMLVAKKIAFLILTVFASSWLTKKSLIGQSKLPEWVTSAIKGCAEFPEQVADTMLIFKNLFPPTGLAKKYEELEQKITLTNDSAGFLLQSYINEAGENLINLSRVRDGKSLSLIKHSKISGSEIISDKMPDIEILRRPQFTSRNRMWSPHLDRNGTLTFIYPWNDFVAIDIAAGRELWRVKGAFHHSIEVDHFGNYWVCGASTLENRSNKNQSIRYSRSNFEDQTLVNVSKNGKIIKSISVTDLLLNSGLEYLLYGVTNPDRVYDPLHLNQISPVLIDSGPIKKGYIVASLRNLSTIIVVDPIRERIVWSKTGPWMNQHSVRVDQSGVIILLDNHSFADGYNWISDTWRTKILAHNLITGFTSELLVSNRDLELKIPIAGRISTTSSGAYVLEDDMRGALMVFLNGELVYKWINEYPNGNVGFTSWCRHMEYEDLPSELKKRWDEN